MHACVHVCRVTVWEWVCEDVHVCACICACVCVCALASMNEHILAL